MLSSPWLVDFIRSSIPLLSSDELVRAYNKSTHPEALILEFPHPWFLHSLGLGHPLLHLPLLLAGGFGDVTLGHQEQLGQGFRVLARIRVLGLWTGNRQLASTNNIPLLNKYFLHCIYIYSPFCKFELSIDLVSWKSPQLFQRPKSCSDRDSNPWLFGSQPTFNQLHMLLVNRSLPQNPDGHWESNQSLQITCPACWPLCYGWGVRGPGRT